MKSRRISAQLNSKDSLQELQELLLAGVQEAVIGCDDLPSDSMYPILAFLKAGASISESSLGSDLTCLISETMRPIMRPP